MNKRELQHMYDVKHALLRELMESMTVEQQVKYMGRLIGNLGITVAKYGAAVPQEICNELVALLTSMEMVIATMPDEEEAS